MTVPALNMGGWYDLFLGGTLANYVGMKQRGGSAVARAHQRLVIGPWSHINQTGAFPERSYGLMASSDVVDLDGMQLRWHDHWLKGQDNGVEQDKIDTSMTFPRSPPLETRSGRSVCRDDRLLPVFAS
jgi:putative CocE/NonD family hydrolase